VVTDEKGFYQVELPIDLYRMTAEASSISAVPLTKYDRMFQVKSPRKIVLNGNLNFARTNCDAIVSGDESSESLKDICGGEDEFKVPSTDTPLQMFVQYPQRSRLGAGFTYSIDRESWPDVRVSITYNLFSLDADKVIYDSTDDTVRAEGNVLVTDASGTVTHGNLMVFRLRDGKAALLSAK
jgi:hypothetical protein